MSDITLWKNYKVQLSLILFIAGAVSLAAFVGISLTGRVVQGQIAEKCLEIQNSPELRYPCSCVPTPAGKYANESPEIEEKTSALCTCTCYLPGNKTHVVDVRVAK